MLPPNASVPTSRALLQVYPDGLDKGQVAGIVVGCILAGCVLGALAMLCYLKRRRLFPAR